MKICIFPKQIAACLTFLMVLASVLLPVSAAGPEEQQIWEHLVQLTDNPVAAAGIMGNLYYESNLDPGRVQNADSLPVPEEDYADLSQRGIYEDFAEDGHGYGLCQWTFPSRKLRLLELAEAQGCSMGNVEVQLHLLGEELEQYNMLYRISHADSIRFASDYFLTNYENPGVQDESVKERRAEKGRCYYDQFMNPIPEAEELTQAQQDVVRIAAHSGDYGIPAESGYCMAWVTGVYREAGLSPEISPSALASAQDYCVSTDLSEIPVGAAVYGRRNKEYGHIGIYMGDGTVRHNVGGVISTNLEDWIAQYDGFCWGWPGGIDLTASSQEENHHE